MAGQHVEAGRERHRRGCWPCWARSTPSTGASRLSELARRADLPLPTAHRLVGELAGWGALARRPVGAVRRRPAAVGPRAARPGADRVCAQVASPFLHDIYAATRATVHLAVRDGHRGALPRPVVRQRLGAGGQPGRFPAAACTPPASARCCSPTRRRRCRPTVLANLTRHHAVHDHPAGPAAAAAAPGSRRRATRQTNEEMSLGRLLGRRPDPRRRRRWSRRAGHRRARASKRDRARLVAALQVAAQGIGAQPVPTDFQLSGRPEVACAWRPAVGCT